MKVELQEVQGSAGCVVKLDGCAVRFRRCDEARAFVARLQARLAAPHRLPSGGAAAPFAARR